MSVEEAIDLYLDLQRAKGNAEVSVETTEHRLCGLMGDKVCALELCSLTPKKAQRIYDKRVGERPPGTHHSELREAKTWSKWLVKRGYLSTPPFGAVELVGRANRGKAQLTIDEARKLAAHCLERAELGDIGAVAALLALGLGLRSGEIRGLEPRDIDDDGRMLIVRREVTKSKDARRLVIPAFLQGVVSADQLPLGLSKNGLLSRVRTLCKHADVTVVTAHGLRGTHATLAAAAGATSEYVATSLGHTSAAVTERHYARADAIQSGRASRVALKIVEGGKS